MAGRGATAPTAFNTLDLPGTAGNYAWTPSTNPISTGLDFRAKVAPSNWGSDVVSLINKFSGNGNSSYRWELLGGTLRLITYNSSSNGDNAQASADASVSGYANGSTHWVRVTWRNSDGRVQHFKSDDGTSWTQVGSNITASTSPVNAGSRMVEVGSSDGGAQLMFLGNIYYVEMRSSIDGPVVLSFDATAVTKLGTRNPTTWVAPTGETWTVAGSTWDWEEVPA